MAFLKRLGWYLVGLSIGIVFLVFFLKKKSGESGIEFCYFPNCRVLKDMRSKPLVFDDNLPLTYRDTLLVQSFLKDGDVDFKRSDTESKPCKTYFIEQRLDGRNMELVAQNCLEQVIVQRVEIKN
ncbi:DUF4258 domain-containing protein [Muricauda sp. JGD-17]|uniref:DUF4258 domain-containing protein n=1 Tax=Flagellimonas ochracea TaxID=2696472 RepID=A0A964TCK8_9FLAO|nr:DUF4258 domain-containing protein [Allomuricauda ochracea]NAY91021.1 DUF4258 domain-containing protein [Allomuricauda ochracea]